MGTERKPTSVSRRISIKLTNQVFHTNRAADVDLPIRVDLPAITARLVLHTVGSAALLGLAIFGHGTLAPWVKTAFLGLASLWFVSHAIQLITRRIIGTKLLVVSEEGIDDARLGCGLIEWAAIERTRVVVAKGLVGVFLYLKPGHEKTGSIVGSLYTVGLPIWHRRRVFVELRSVERNEVVLAAIEALSMSNSR